MGTSTFTRLEIDDGSMSIWMILRGFRREVRRAADHAVVETGTHGEARRSNASPCWLRRCRACRACPRSAVGGREAAEAHQGVGAREAQLAHQRGELVGRVAEHHATAGIDHRAPGFEQELHRLLDLAVGAPDHRVVGAHRHRLRVFEFALLGGDVLWISTSTGPGRPVGDVNAFFMVSSDVATRRAPGSCA